MFGLNLPTITNILNILGDATQDNAFSHCNILCTSTIDESVTVCLDGSVFTVFEVVGTQRYLTEETEIDHIDAVQRSTSSTLKIGNHKIGMMFVRDPSRTEAQLRDIFKPTFDTIDRLGLGSSHFFERQMEDLEKNCSFERTLMVVTTSRASMHTTERDKPTLNGKEVVVDEIPLLLQDTARESIDIIQEHQAYVKDVKSRFSRYLGLLQITSETFLKYLKEEEELISLSKTNWQSKNATTPIDLTLNYGEEDFVCHPPCAYQIISDDKKAPTRTSSLIQSGDYYIATLDREYFNIQDYSTFQELFRSIGKRIPFRAYFELETGTQSIRTMLAARKTFLILFRVSAYGRSIDNALGNLIREADDNNRTLLKGTMSIATWSTDEELTKKYKQELKQALTSWGSPVFRTPSHLSRSYFSTLPAFAKKNSARPCVQVDTKHLSTLPLTRPATPMKSGTICLSSQDGKLFPISVVCPDQDYIANFILGPMKSGKTVFSSILNNAFLLAEGNQDLPLMSYLDFGSGVHNYFNSLRAWLPKSQLHKIACIAMQNAKGNAYNIFEPQFGLSRLEPFEVEFTIKFLSRLINGDSAAPVSGQLANTLARLIKLFFNYAEENPLPYEQKLGFYVGPEMDYHKDINKLLRDGVIKVEPTDTDSWYTIRDKLFMLDEVRYFDHARFCHRQGSHALPDFLAYVRSDSEARASMDALAVEPAGVTPLVDYIITAIEGVISRFSDILGEKSQIDVSQAKIVGVDVKGLFQSVSDESMKQVFALLARHLASRNFWRDPKNFMTYVPELYIEHYRRILDSEKNIKKHEFIDEYLQFKSKEMDEIVDSVNVIARKYNLGQSIAAQQMEHAPKGFLSLATNIYVLAATPKDVDVLKRTYKLSDSFANEISRRLKQSDGFGRLILYIGQFGSYEGYVVQLLRNQITPSYLWNFSSDENDETIKHLAKLKFGELSAYDRLGKAYPSGTCLGEIQKLISGTVHNDKPLTTHDAIATILKNLEHAA
ncbi:conserved hypothetical protein [Vibrio nigripulchritudo SOn1]|uniref:Uncharacterized protein n=1 Tax=Vibrio nigripulchritudo SOn1 TaxID=1238450 RepID=A0AAV2VQH9_9VIBR|nr:hypothetical protein [Vibrio nigripulchritudo]CCO46807.1 conserved hypothetical protein [Vibrio nigripulchritudo SOn1]